MSVFFSKVFKSLVFCIDPVSLDCLSFSNNCVSLMVYFYSPPLFFNPSLTSYHPRNCYGFFLFANIVCHFLLKEERNRCMSSVCYLEQVDMDENSVNLMEDEKKEKKLLWFLWNLIWDYMRNRVHYRKEGANQTWTPWQSGEEDRTIKPLLKQNLQNFN